MNNVSRASSQKQLGIILDVKLTFDKYLNNLLDNVNKAIDHLYKLENLLSRSTLITIYKAFVIPYFHYGDILYVQTYNSSFRKKLEPIQYNVYLALTEAIRGSSKDEFQELTSISRT